MKTSPGPKSVRQRLNQFAIAAILAVGLLAFAWPVAAEVVYTPTNITIGCNGSYNLDVNKDGVTDFTISIADVPSCFLLLSGSVSETAASENGALIGPLSDENEIGPGQNFSGGAVGLESFSNHCNRNRQCWFTYSGPWHVGAKGKRYLGLSFQVNGETYYGWVQLTFLKGGADGVKVSGYAYESTAGCQSTQARKNKQSRLYMASLSCSCS